MFGNDDMSVSTFYCNPQNSPIKRPSMARNQGNRNGRIRREAIVASDTRKKLKKAVDKSKMFKKRRAPVRLNPMQSLVTTNQQDPNIDSVESKSNLQKQILAIALAKKNMKVKRSSMALDHSKVKTPAVLSFMQGLTGVDDAGLGIYRSDVDDLDEALTQPHLNEEKMNPIANSIIDSWVKSFDIEKQSYESVSVFAEVRLKEALAATEGITALGKDGLSDNDGNYFWEVIEGVRTKVEGSKDNDVDGTTTIPSQVRIAMCCDLMRKVSGMFGRYEGLMKTLTEEMVRCIYSDYDSVLLGVDYVNARTFYHCTPYFEALQNCEIHRDELVEELGVYNDGVDLRKAIAKCSVGVKTMFNDARRAIRDIIFKVWKNYVMQRTRKMKKLRLRVQLEPYFNMWKNRHTRFKDHGYFYDSGSEADTDDEDLRREEEEYDHFESSMRSQLATQIGGSSYDKLMARMNHNASPSSVSSESSEEAPKLIMGRIRAITQRVITKSRATTLLSHGTSLAKYLKIIKTQADVNGRMIKHCERRRCHVDLVDMACQTDFDSPVQVLQPKEPEPTLEPAAKGKQTSMKSILGGGKEEKAMSLENGLQLIPALYEQYLVMLANPGPDTVGKHLNLVKFTQDALIRKFGIKKIAMKQFRSLGSLLTSKKAMDHPRMRVFASLVGMSMHIGEEGPGYNSKYVDFFFQRILPHVFHESKKQVNAILGAKGHSDIDMDKFLKRMEDIFPNFLKKDGFKYIVLEDKVEKKMSRKTKGIEMVDADVVLECLVDHWQQELILANDNMTWDIMRLIKNFQQRVKTMLRLKKVEYEAEHGMEDKWKEKFGDDGFPKNSAEFVEWTKVENSIKLKDNVSDAILNELHDKLFAYKEKKKKVEKRKSEHNNARDHKATAPTISEYFAVSVWRMSLLEVKKPEKTEDEKVEEQANHSHHHRHSHALNIVKHDAHVHDKEIKRKISHSGSSVLSTEKERLSEV